MNTERILKLADVIEKVPHKPMPSKGRVKKRLRGFNMENWHCGTVGCIAGWAGEIFECSHAAADEVLGLNWKDADRLFYAHGSNQSTTNITPAHAAAVLRHLAATGKVDWSVTP